MEKKSARRPFAPTQEVGEIIYLLGMGSDVVKLGENNFSLKGTCPDDVTVERTTVAVAETTRPKDNPTGMTSVGRRARIKGIMVDNQYPHANHGLNGLCHALWRPNELVQNVCAYYTQEPKESNAHYNERIRQLLAVRGISPVYVELELGVNLLQHRIFIIQEHGLGDKADLPALQATLDKAVALTEEKYPEIKLEKRQLIEGGAEFFSLVKIGAIADDTSAEVEEEEA